MRKEGTVSLWIGKIESEEELNMYVEIPYIEDEEIHTSKFGESFKISRYDEDFIEIKYSETPMNELRELLKGHSYDEIIIPKFINLYGSEQLMGENAIILLYNFEYGGAVKKYDNGKIHFEYIGTVQYES